jgi:hypothetical protein
LQHLLYEDVWYVYDSAISSAAASNSASETVERKTSSTVADVIWILSSKSDAVVRND